MDAEVSASGFTRQMEKDLLAEIGWNEDNEEETTETVSAKVEKEEDIESLRAELEQSMLEDEKKYHKSKITTEKEENVGQEPSTNKAPSIIPIPVSADCSSEENLSDADTDVQSVRSVSTTSTIPPEIIQERVKKALAKRNRMALRQRCLAKGEASAVTRNRRENRHTIKDSAGIWGLD